MGAAKGGCVLICGPSIDLVALQSITQANDIDAVPALRQPIVGTLEFFCMDRIPKLLQLTDSNLQIGPGQTVETDLLYKF